VAAHLGQWYSIQTDAKLRSRTIPCYENALAVFRKNRDYYYVKQVTETLILLYSKILHSNSEELGYDQTSYALRQLIMLFLNSGNIKKAITACRQLLEESELNKNYPDQLEAAISLGHSLLKLKVYDEAIEAHSKAIGVLNTIRTSELDDSYLIAEAELQLSLGQAYRHTNQLSCALICYEKAEKITQKIVAENIKYRAMGNKGLIFADQKQHKKAIELLTEAHNYFQEEGDYRLAGHGLFNLAYAYYRNGDQETAKKIGTEALHDLTMINDSVIGDIRQQMDCW
jgi:tetratricopeptide (TPR) repeat protein